jgi:hypothetical protein
MMKDSTRETVAISVGLSCLGLAAGAIAGATVTAGASQALLTGVLTFVGGAVVSYSAFVTKQQAQKKAGKKDGEPEPPAANVTRIGVGLAVLSLSLLLGAVLGMWFRYRDPFGIAPTPTACARATTEVTGEAKPFGLQSGITREDVETVERVRTRLKSDWYKTQPALEDLQQLVAVARKCTSP